MDNIKLYLHEDLNLQYYLLWRARIMNKILRILLFPLALIEAWSMYDEFKQLGVKKSYKECLKMVWSEMQDE